MPNGLGLLVLSLTDICTFLICTVAVVMSSSSPAVTEERQSLLSCLTRQLLTTSQLPTMIGWGKDKRWDWSGQIKFISKINYSEKNPSVSKSFTDTTEEMKTRTQCHRWEAGSKRCRFSVYMYHVPPNGHWGAEGLITCACVDEWTNEWLCEWITRGPA